MLATAKNKIITVGATFICSLATVTLFTQSTYATDPTITVTYPYYAFVENPENPWATVYDALDETGTVDYSDAFFSTPSPGDHPKLRAMSYALALAGFENQADGYPSTSADINPKLINLLNQLGFSDYQSWDVSSELNGHSMGTTIGRKTLASDQDLIVVAPRNYNYMTEWLSNFNVGTTGDHAGFTESVDLIINRLDQYLAGRDLKNYKIWIVGYSRGGAVVDLAAKKINENLANYSMSTDDFYVYTFGAPRASVEEPNYSNIHDVKDGNDLILGYMFPEEWGFYNTGTYEEIHPADLKIDTSVVDITNLADSSKAFSVLSSNDGSTKKIGSVNGRDFMDSWVNFVNDNGLTREYFDLNIKPPLSAVMQAYQLRTIDKQGAFTNFFTDISKGLAGMVAYNAFSDLTTNYGGNLDNYPAYLDLVKMLKGTATDADVDELIAILTGYMGEYADYETLMGESPAVTEVEFSVIKENLPKLVRALAPLLIADAKYTQETFGENYSLFYTYSLISNAENLVIGHIPESIMPILKSLIPSEAPDENHTPNDEENTGPTIPSTGAMSKNATSSTENYLAIAAAVSIILIAASIFYMHKKKHNKNLHRTL